MKNALTLTALLLACAAGAFSQLITTPGTKTGHWFEAEACPAIRQTARDAIRRIPFSGLLDWDGVNDYTPRPSILPLEVVSPSAAGYTPAEISEIYPSH
jgi:hypothetical protein